MNPAVVAIIKGGLGNQLFGYAAARAYALRSGRELWIDDRSGYHRDGYGRSYRLQRFPIAARPADPRFQLGDPKKLRHKWVRSLNKILPTHLRNYHAERSGQPAAGLIDFHSNRETIYLNGYWQDEACFSDFAAPIRQELDPPALKSPEDRELEREIEESCSVFLHIRRVRYSPRLGADYYQSSISAARQALADCCFEVFGDDIGWAREHLDFSGSPVRFHESGSDDELRDFRLMSRCRHAITANSSFSWWAAWLIDAPDKKVWFPQTPGWPVKAAARWTQVPNSLES
ncbi:MAG: alpha-1,2-fucosyltransferase [Akkermansiaceae bacterium]|nr:alpha-1,2-fucosyltransferase [Akkermansiaceae bacterium]